MNKQNTNDLLLDSPQKVENTSEENTIEQLASLEETPFYTDALNETNINNIISDQRPELIVLFGLNDLGK